jgi:phosphoribosylglycinamide formyltransferase-1
MTLRITILTYDAPHRKTHDVLQTMLLRNCFDIQIATVPMIQRAERNVLFNHRPKQFVGPSIRQIAKAHSLMIRDFENWRSFHNESDYFVVCGANLLDGEFCTNNKVLNCHPGLIPMTRGLDSFKWTILNGSEIGNTLHFIDAGVDLGTVIHHQMTDVFEDDDLTSLSERHYLNELYLLSHFDFFLTQGKVYDLPLCEPTKRMPIELEAQMISGFDQFKAERARQPAM